MVRQYSFVPIVTLLLSSLAWWSDHLQTSSQIGALSNKKAQQVMDWQARRGQLIETMDSIVFQEKFFHSMHGKYSADLSQVGSKLPRELLAHYILQITDASRNHFLLTALSRPEDGNDDLVSVDQDFQVHANFPLPSPSYEYLQKHAVRHLQQLKALPTGRAEVEEGIYRGYFRYSHPKSDPALDQIHATAVGVLPPVEGVSLELDDRGVHLVSYSGSILLSNKVERSELFKFHNFNNEVGQDIVSGRSPAQFRQELLEFEPLTAEDKEK